MSKWFGESNTNVRNLFARAKTLKPSIIFLDELDGICPERNNSASSVAYNSIVATLLGEMDNLPVGQVFVFGATNRVETVDSAMRRPGRFDKHLEFFIPDLAARTKIIQINTKKWKSASRPSGNYLEILAQQASGYTGADLEKLCREAFFAAFSRHVPNSNLEISIDNMQVYTEWT